MPNKLSIRAADNLRLMRSDTLLELADGTYNIFRIPKFAFVDQVWLYITQAYSTGTGTATGTIGFVGNGETADPDGFMDATACAVTSTGMKIMTADAQPGSQGKWFNAASGMLTITLDDDGEGTLMVGYVFMRYTVLV